MARRNSAMSRLVGLLLATVALIGCMALLKAWTPKLGLDLQGGTTITLTASNAVGGGTVDATSLDQARNIIQQRVDALGVGEAEVTTSGGNQIIVSVPNVQQDELVRMVGQTAVLTFRQVHMVEPVAPTDADPSAAPTATPTPGSTPSPGDTPAPTATPSTPAEPQLPPAPRPNTEGSGWEPKDALTWEPSAEDMAEFADWTCGDPFTVVSDQPTFACDETEQVKYLLSPALVKGDQLANASAGVPQNSVAWVVNLEFDSQGAALFRDASTAMYTLQPPLNQFAIVLDGRVISAPQFNEPIPGGRAQISGSSENPFNQTEAQQLANVLKYGALPLAFDVSSVDNVSATLGGEQLRAGLIAGAIGLALVILFAFYVYQALASVIIASLVVAFGLTYSLIVLLGEGLGLALNLPGIAGLIVGLGMTADSFIIYFERIKDEIRQGHSIRSAVEEAWLRTRSTLLISDAVQMLSAVVLFVLAIGGVKGFAFTLGLTTFLDLVMIFFFTKPIMTVLARTKYFGQGGRWSGLSADRIGVKKLPGGRRAARRGGAA